MGWPGERQRHAMSAKGIHSFTIILVGCIVLFSGFSLIGNNVRATNYDINTDTWWTTSITGQGANDSTSLANRMPIPTDIDHLKVWPGHTLYVVLEDRDGVITIDQGKSFHIHGIFKTVNSTGDFDPLSPYRLAVGGTTIKKFRDIHVDGCLVNNVDWAQDSIGRPTNKNDDKLKFYGGTHYNCTFRNDRNDDGYVMGYGGGYNSCTFYGGNNGTGVVLKSPNAFFENCTFNTSNAVIINAGEHDDSTYVGFRIINNITFEGGTTGMVELDDDSQLVVTRYGRLYGRTIDNSTSLPLAGVAWGLLEHNEKNFDNYLNIGFTENVSVSGAPPGAIHTYLDEEANGAFSLPYGLLRINKTFFFSNTSVNMPILGPGNRTETHGNYTFFAGKEGYELYSYNWTFNGTVDIGEVDNRFDMALVPITNTTIWTNSTIWINSTIWTNDTIWINATETNSELLVNVLIGVTPVIVLAIAYNIVVGEIRGGKRNR